MYSFFRSGPFENSQKLQKETPGTRTENKNNVLGLPETYPDTAEKKMWKEPPTSFKHIEKILEPTSASTWRTCSLRGHCTIVDLDLLQPLLLLILLRAVPESLKVRNNVSVP